MSYYVYILANKPFGTLYVGVTNDLVRRIYEHKEHLVEGFTKKYDVTMLVHVEVFGDIENAILREKKLKRWKRDWKIDLINESNPDWQDLYTKL